MPCEPLRVAIEVKPCEREGKPLWLLLRYDQTGQYPQDAEALIHSVTGDQRFISRNSTEQWIGLDVNSADELSKILHKLQEGAEVPYYSKEAEGYRTRPSNTFVFDRPFAAIMQEARHIISAGIQKT